MQVIINIPEEDYDYLCVKKEAEGQDLDYYHQLILNGTPLPKGHGNLKDVGKCDRKLFYQQCGGVDSLITAKTAFDMLLSLPTIIGADKESEDKE